MAMTERSDVLYRRGLDFFGEVAASLDAADWDRPSGCEGWTARDVAGHVASAMRMGNSFLRGEVPTPPHIDRPGDLVEGDPLAFFTALAEESRAALDGVDLDKEIDTPMGRRTIGAGLAFPAMDLFIHAWDIGRTNGAVVEIPDEVIEFAHHYTGELPPEMLRSPGVFGAETEVPDDATASERFLAWTGRRPR